MFAAFSSTARNFLIFLFCLIQASISNSGCGVNIDWSDMLADYDGTDFNNCMKTDLSIFVMAKVTLICLFTLLFLLVAREPWRQSNSWGDIVDEEPARPPGHGIHMHEKLSSPSRKRCTTS